MFCRNSQMFISYMLASYISHSQPYVIMWHIKVFMFFNINATLLTVENTHSYIESKRAKINSIFSLHTRTYINTYIHTYVDVTAQENMHKNFPLQTDKIFTIWFRILIYKCGNYKLSWFVCPLCDIQHNYTVLHTRLYMCLHIYIEAVKIVLLSIKVWPQIFLYFEWYYTIC